jgi:acyl-CoA thioester hydrolase
MIELTLRIDWSEMDMFGHVNNVSYFKYVQASRVNYWEKIGLSSQFNQHQIGPLLASTGCQFKKPLFYPGTVVIKASVEYIKNTSFGIKHQLFNEKNELVAEANDIVVLFDFSKNEKTLFPDWLRQKVEEVENKKFV